MEIRKVKKPKVTAWLIFVLGIISISLYAQNPTEVIPPSPEAAAFLRYGEIPVDYSTGIPKIEIPIYTITEGNLSVPITISYHASGIKAMDIASEVGLGFVLNTGGILVKNIFGAKDEEAYPS